MVFDMRAARTIAPVKPTTPENTTSITDVRPSAVRNRFTPSRLR